ncbi:alanine racemase [Microbacterium sp. A84]|uniref:alanine racemase n=1 Tax=Microbacterium sp. A84 TaxID=3450715 RepID=UPI003F434A6A
MQPILHISRAQFLTNLDAVRARISPSALMLVMKDDAYGHGIDWAVDAAATADVQWYGSYDVRTGIRIREALGDRAGRVFAWATSTVEEVEAAVRADIDLGVGTEEYLRLVIATAERIGVLARVHLKIDTGLHRSGIRPEAWAATAALARAAELTGAPAVVGVWSHLAEASDDEDDEAQTIFVDAVAAVRATGSTPEALHLTASAASWWRPELRGSLSRIGAFCYGIRSADGPELEGIRPISALSASVQEVHDDHVVVGIGAFDGLPSTLSGIQVGTPAGSRELRSVAQTTSEVSTWPGASIGDAVWILGPGEHGEQTATTLAEHIDTVGEEIITRLTSRVRRVISDG